MTIVVTGGGSGGHITPLLAVTRELKRIKPDAVIVYIGQKGDSLGDIPAHDPSIDQSYTVRAGKFRRYHGQGFKQLLDLPTMYKNVRDLFYVIAGIGQSHRLLRAIQPDMIFIKGGFVGVPVGLAAARLHLPFITHDSDAIPGLANRIIGRWARLHTVALSADVYPYPPDKTITTGIPLIEDFKPVTPKLQESYKHALKLSPTSKLLFIIGGGLGAERINLAVIEALPHLLHEFPDLHVVHVAGRNNETATITAYDERLLESKQRERVVVYGFIDNVYHYSGAADLVITRAGATNLAEFATQGKACIVIPNPFLTAGHQLKNVRILEDKEAAVILSEQAIESDPNKLAKQISILLKDAGRREELGRNFSELAQPSAAHTLAMLLLEEATGDSD